MKAGLIGVTLATAIFSSSAFGAFDPTLVYENDSLAPGWNNTSNISINLTQNAIVYNGSSAIRADFPTGTYGNFVVQDPTGVSPLNRKVLSVAVSGGHAYLYGNTLWVRIRVRIAGQSADTWLDAKQLSTYIGGPGFVPPDVWMRLDIPLSDLYKLGSQTPNVQRIKGLAFQNATGTIFYSDDIRFSGFHFPLKGRVDRKDLTPFNTRVVAVFDNNATAAGVVAYNGQTGTVGKFCYDPPACSVNGYKRDTNGTPFNLPLIMYDDEVPPLYSNVYLFYDNHKGYDYAPNNVVNAPIYAAEAGILCAATMNTVKNGAVWRNTSKCPAIGGNAAMSWTTYHTLYIIHPGGSSTWYLHDDSSSTEGLEPYMYQSIKDNGYAVVLRAQHIAYVGAEGAGTHNHLHFGFRNASGALADPYGDDDGNDSTPYNKLMW